MPQRARLLTRSSEALITRGSRCNIRGWKSCQVRFGLSRGTTKRRRRRRRRGCGGGREGKGGKKGEEDRNGWVGDGEGTMERLFWQDTKRHFICPVVEGRNLSCSSCHLPSIGAFLNRFPPSSSNCSTYSLQLTRRIVFAALFLHLQRDTSLPLETSVTRDIPFLRCFSSLLPFPFFFSSIRSNYVSRDPTVIS